MLASSIKPDVIYISSSKVACDGDAESAHPRVYLTVNTHGTVDCPYCGKHYELEKGAKTDAH